MKTLLIAFLSILTITSQAEEGLVNFQMKWCPNTQPNVVGYNVFWGDSTGYYKDGMFVLDPKADITLSPGRYYFVAAAVYVTGNQSPYTQEFAYCVGEQGDVVQIPGPPPGWTVLERKNSRREARISAAKKWALIRKTGRGRAVGR